MIELNAIRRPAEDILGRSIRFRLGDQQYSLTVRSIRRNREWLAALDESTTSMLSSLESAGDDLATIYGVLASQSGVLIDALVSYAPDELPTREQIEDIEPDATMDVLNALSEVWRAANPLVAMSLAAMAPTTTDTASSAPTSGPRKSTAGRRPSSKTG